MKKILFAGSEAMPFVSTGGLGDVLGSLPTALAQNENLDVRVILPLYSAIDERYKKEMQSVAQISVRLSWRRRLCEIYSLEKNGVTYYFIDDEYYFARRGIYGEFDDGERFAYFSMAVIEAMSAINFIPDVMHAHDWQSALCIVYLNHIYKNNPRYQGVKTIFTIHNIEYQGKYELSILKDVFSLGENERSLMEHNGCINLMKAAIEDADIVTTVSPKYSEEIKTPEFAHGLHASLTNNAHKLRGILNGIDYSYYDPKNNKVIAENYSSANTSGKAVCKSALQKELGLEVRENVPVLAIISRLAHHKGVDIIEGCIHDILSSHDVQLVILGKGEEKYERFFCCLQESFPTKVRAMITYDRDFSKRLYSACDIFLMPSISEPCGLSQMIASRYGAIPVVRETGGLYDSIKHFWLDKNKIVGNGFTFAGTSSDELRGKIEEAIALYHDKELLKRLVYKIMRTDFSWKKSAIEYADLYTAITEDKNEL